MTRINVVPVSELCDKHLLAEYRELPRVFGLARLCSDAPKEYVLGTGHVKFFYDKLLYLCYRHKELVSEARRRGFNVQFEIEPWHIERHSNDLINDYIPTPEALAINRERIADRLATMKLKVS